MYVQSTRYSPVGEYLRLLIMQRLAQGPARVEEVDELAKRAVERVGVRYDWRIWPELLRREVAVRDGVAELTDEGRWLLKTTRDVVAEYVRRTLGVALG
ncbi:hypothetical protein [Thermoproteus uzoniensis]|nr:hypothetical protein [Thermoproteus uzoniensis]